MGNHLFKKLACFSIIFSMAGQAVCLSAPPPYELSVTNWPSQLLLNNTIEVNIELLNNTSLPAIFTLKANVSAGGLSLKGTDAGTCPTAILTTGFSIPGASNCILKATITGTALGHYVTTLSPSIHRGNILLIRPINLTLNVVAAPVDLPSITSTPDGFKLPNGNTIILHGVNEMNKQFPNTPSSIGFDQTQANFIKANGFNIVRLGIFWNAIEPNPLVGSGLAPQYDDAYLADIKNTIEMLANVGIYTMVDFHEDAYSNATHGNPVGVGMGQPAWTAGTEKAINIGFFDNVFGGMVLSGFRVPMMIADDYSRVWNNVTLPDGRALQDAYVAMIEHTVNYLKDTSGVVGYDLMNEPFAGKDWEQGAIMVSGVPVSFSKGYKNFETNTLAPLYNKLIPFINQNSPNAVIFFEPNVLVSKDSPIYLPHLVGKNLALNFHNYNDPSPLTPINTAMAYTKSGVNSGAPIMTEFGGIDPDAAVNAILSEADSLNLSWIYWAYSNNPAFPFFTPPGSQLPKDPRDQGLVYDMSKPLTGNNVKTARLHLLARPYPQIIAGDHISYSYSSTEGLLNLSYVGNTNTGEDAQTQIYLPPDMVNSGYSVSVIGATVISSPVPDGNTSILVIQNDAANTLISVKITTKTGVQ